MAVRTEKGSRRYRRDARGSSATRSHGLDKPRVRRTLDLPLTRDGSVRLEGYERRMRVPGLDAYMQQKRMGPGGGSSGPREDPLPPVLNPIPPIVVDDLDLPYTEDFSDYLQLRSPIVWSLTGEPAGTVIGDSSGVLVVRVPLLGTEPGVFVFDVTVDTAYGSDTQPVSLTVNANPAIITVQPGNLTLLQGGSGQFSVQADHALGTPLFYQWQVRRDDVGSWVSVDDPTNGLSDSSGGETDTLTVNVAALNDAGDIRCRVRAWADLGTYEVLTVEARLNVTATLQPPVLDPIPDIDRDDRDLPDTYDMSVHLAGGDAPTSWQLTGAPAWITIDNAGLLAIDDFDNGAALGDQVFTVTAINAAGSSGQSCTVSIAGTAPDIDTQPQPLAVTAPDGGVFTIAASHPVGTAPLFYLWQADEGGGTWSPAETVLSDASGGTTATLTLNSTIEDDATDVRCRVRAWQDTSDYQVISSTAALTVAPEPPDFPFTDDFTYPDGLLTTANPSDWAGVAGFGEIEVASNEAGYDVQSASGGWAFYEGVPGDIVEAQFTAGTIAGGLLSLAGVAVKTDPTLPGGNESWILVTLSSGRIALDVVISGASQPTPADVVVSPSPGDVIRVVALTGRVWVYYNAGLVMDYTGTTPAFDRVGLYCARLGAASAGWLDSYTVLEPDANTPALGLLPDIDIDEHDLPHVVDLSPYVINGTGLTWTLTSEPGFASIDNAGLLTLALGSSFPGEYDFEVVINNGAGGDSQPISLTLDAVAPTITLQPSNTTVSEPDAGVISCTATHPRGTPLFLWQASTDGSSWGPVTTLFPGASGATTATLNTGATVINTNHLNQLRCRVRPPGAVDGSNEVYTSSAVLTVEPGASYYTDFTGPNRDLDADPYWIEAIGLPSLEIVSAEAGYSVTNSAGALNVFDWDYGSSVEVTATVATVSGSSINGCGLAGRVSGSAGTENHIIVIWSNSELIMLIKVNGVDQTVPANVAYTPQIGDVIKLAVDNSGYIVEVNGNQQFAEFQPSPPMAGSKHGIFCVRNLGTQTAGTSDEFTIGPYTGLAIPTGP